MKRMIGALILGAMLAGCGYHLAGHGNLPGAIPQGTQTVVIHASGLDANLLAQALMARMRVGSNYALIRTNGPGKKDVKTVDLRIENVSTQFIPTAYGQTGIAVQYNMILTASLRLLKDNKMLWQSGVMTESGNVYVNGGPASIEASRDRVEREMRKRWARQAWERLQSGF